jgi:uncharacterized protein YerC
MQASRDRVNPIINKQILSLWYQLMADIKTPQEAETIFSDLLSEIELSAITKRLAVGYYLHKKRSYEVIKNNLKVSSATIASVQSGINKPGWKLALQKMLAEEWATKWEAKIKSLLSKKLK